MEILLMHGAKLDADWAKIHAGDDAKDVLNSFLDSDIDETSRQVLEEVYLMRDSFILDSPTIFQVNEIVDISLPFIDRVNFIENPKGTLKLLLHTKYVDFIGLCDTGVLNLSPLSLPGIKISIAKGSRAKYGVFVLSSDNTTVLGGSSLKVIKRRQELHLSIPNAIPKNEFALPIIEKKSRTKRSSSATREPDEITSMDSTSKVKKTRQKGNKVKDIENDHKNEKTKAKRKPSLRLASKKDDIDSFLSDEEMKSDEIQEIEATIIASQSVDDDKPAQMVNQKPIIHKAPKKGTNISKIDSITNIALVKRNNELIFSISCILNDKSEAKVDNALACKIFNCIPSQFIKLSPDEMEKVSERACKSFIGIEGHVSNGVFFEQ